MAKPAVTGMCVVLLSMQVSPSVAQLAMGGSDTLELVTKDAIVAATLLSLTYLGGGSSVGEIDMVAGLQHVAPMSRELNSGVPDAVKCTPRAQQLLVGLDGIDVLTGNQTGGSNCSDNITGGTTLTGIFKLDGVTPCDANDGCSPAGSYTFQSWRDVLAMVYGGMNNAVANGALLNGAAGASCTYSFVTPTFTSGGDTDETGGDGPCLSSGQVCYPNNKCGDPTVVGRRNPLRINCLNPVRMALVDHWAALFSDVTPVSSCRTGSCTKLRRAFRRDDLSGTTDTFVALVGLPSIPPYTRAERLVVGLQLQNSPLVDRSATANPFCNAGDSPMNKGDADYLDLDPIRRAVDHIPLPNGTGGTNRYGLEQVGEQIPPFGGNNIDANCMPDLDALTPGLQLPIPQDHTVSTEPGVWALPANFASVQKEIGYDPVSVAAKIFPVSRLCLGLVVPITLPANYDTAEKAYFNDPTYPPGIHTCSTTAYVNPGLRPTVDLCPNGVNTGVCLFPIDIGNFNCLSDSLLPAQLPIRDNRVFNIHPVDKFGHYLRDNYLNPNIVLSPTPATNAKLQSRVVSAYYRLHTTRVSNLNGSVPTGGPCRTFTSTEQIGCLVTANTCDLGFAGREAVTSTGNNFAFRIDGVQSSVANIQNLVTGGVPVYPMARRLWLNAVGGFSSLTGDELGLFNFESSPTQIDTLILNHNFVTVPPSVTRLRGCPSGL
jgi:hypothetical protein